MSTALRRACLLVALFVGGPSAGLGQTPAEPVPFCEEPGQRHETPDTRGLAALYCAPPPGLARPLDGLHSTARPVFYGAVPAAWGVAVLRGGGVYGTAYRLTLSQGVSYGLVTGLKRAIGRPRPYVRRALTARAARYGPSKGGKYRAFPSGHAALSATLATSWSLSHPRWYVVGPAVTWAVGVSLSRLYLGVHYPSDVLAGIVLGGAVAGVVHRLRGALTPPGLRTDDGPGPVPVGLRLRF